MALTNKEKESLDRLEAILDNPALAEWYHHQFIDLGFIPVQYKLPEDIKNWRKLVRKLNA